MSPIALRSFEGETQIGKRSSHVLHRVQTGLLSRSFFLALNPREDGMGNRYLYDNHTLKTNRSMLGYEKE